MGRKKRPFEVRKRAFAIWQKLGYLPWRRERTARDGKSSRDFYRGAFNDIPFLNDDAKRTFGHLLLRPGYMIRDYISGQHERYLAPLTALIIFYAFFALVSSLLQPIQQEPEDPFADPVTVTTGDGDEDAELKARLISETVDILRKGYTYLHLDEYPDAVKTPQQAALAAVESRLRSQGIPLFLGEFFLLWFAMALALRRYKLGAAACATASAYVLCQFSFFMLFSVLLTWGRQTSIGIVLMAILLTVDYRQLLGISWGKSIRRTLATGIYYFLIYGLLLILVSIGVVILAYFRGNIEV